VVSLVLPQTVLDPIDTELAKLEKEFVTEDGQSGGMLWAVRSSASDEDAADATFGGIYRTVLGVPRDSIAAAILDCWASLWTAVAFTYRERVSKSRSVPAMAVILQPLLAPRAAGVAYSRHPISGRADQIMINAVFGLAEPLVSGLMRPDQYVVEIGSDPASLKLIQRDIVEKTKVRVAMPWGPMDRPLPESDERRSVLEEREVLALARLVKEVECAVGKPVDVEWADDTQGFWLLQARPIPERDALPDSTTIVWSRANFRETLPELPSPLGLSLLDGFMETHIVRCYRELGCRILPGVSSVRVIRGRPFINVTLFQSVMAQLGGDPALLAEQMGGETFPVPLTVSQLPWWRIAILMEWKIRRAARRAPKWFQEMRRLGARCKVEFVRALTPVELLAWEEELSRHSRTNGDLTFATFTGVSQGFYVMKLLLERLGPRGGHPEPGVAGSWDIIAQADSPVDGVAERPAATGGSTSSGTGCLTVPDRTTGTVPPGDAYLADYGHGRSANPTSCLRVSEVLVRPQSSRGTCCSSSRPPRSMWAESQDRRRCDVRAGFGRWHEWACYGGAGGFAVIWNTGSHRHA
jgi:pyruvate,water dikinase